MTGVQTCALPIYFRYWNSIFNNPLHPYTKALLSAIPVPKVNQKKERILLKGDVPSPINPPSGCRFASRCSYAMDICTKVSPELKLIDGTTEVACHLYK